MDDKSTDRFVVWAETDGHSMPLVHSDLPFGRLFDEIVVPYQNEEPFFIDGAPVKAKELKRIKILRAKSGLAHALGEFNWILKNGAPELQRIYGQQYSTRYEAILREKTEDVTAQIIKAYDRAIKPSIKDYLPKRDELLGAATKVFVEAMKALGS